MFWGMTRLYNHLTYVYLQFNSLIVAATTTSRTTLLSLSFPQHALHLSPTYLGITFSSSVWRNNFSQCTFMHLLWRSGGKLLTESVQCLSWDRRYQDLRSSEITSVLWINKWQILLIFSQNYRLRNQNAHLLQQHRTRGASRPNFILSYTIQVCWI